MCTLFSLKVTIWTNISSEIPFSIIEFVRRWPQDFSWNKTLQLCNGRMSYFIKHSVNKKRDVWKYFIEQYWMLLKNKHSYKLSLESEIVYISHNLCQSASLTEKKNLEKQFFMCLSSMNCLLLKGATHCWTSRSENKLHNSFVRSLAIDCVVFNLIKNPI